VIPSAAVSSGRGNTVAVATALATLKDVAGIAGSFVFTSSGHLVARELHAMFDDAALREAAERLTRLSDTFASVGDHLDLAVIRFQDHKLYLKVLSGGMLCILADGIVNMAALRMAANLVGRRITPDLDQADAQGDALPPMTLGGSTLPVANRMPETLPSSSAAARPPVVTPGTGRRFRGRPLE
jgi:predicted regulator of Ras-like GTPase activity (Roadblock/LC7/MglB family)